MGDWEKVKCKRCDGTGWLEPIGPCSDGSYITSRRCSCHEGHVFERKATPNGDEPRPSGNGEET